MEDVDVAIVGGGFGGLATALKLSDAGCSVALYERLPYPGGCASTFERKGYHFETGATLFAGFGDGQAMKALVERYDLDVDFQLLDPVIEFRTGEVELVVSPRREQLHSDLIERARNKSGARAALEAQTRVADVLWDLLDEPSLLPPLSMASVARHATRLSAYARLLRWAGRPMREFLDAFDLQHDPMMRPWWDATSQITVQASTDSADTLFALGAGDYFLRGAAHVVGGIGQLAEALVRAIEARGGVVSLADEVRGLRREAMGWRVESRRGTRIAREVVSAVLPSQTKGLLPAETGHRALRDLAAAEMEGWSAAMLYRVIDDAPRLPRSASHLELIADANAPFVEGNHVFCSVGSADEAAARGYPGVRTITMSTHVPMRGFDTLDNARQAALADRIHEKMRDTVRRRAPELEAVRREMTASPRTWVRYTGRTHGVVGGIPRRAGWAHYFDVRPRPVAPGLWLAGDSVFPGQSVLATVIGGDRLAATIARKLGRRTDF